MRVVTQQAASVACCTRSDFFWEVMISVNSSIEGVESFLRKCGANFCIGKLKRRVLKTSLEMRFGHSSALATRLNHRRS